MSRIEGLTAWLGGMMFGAERNGRVITPLRLTVCVLLIGAAAAGGWLALSTPAATPATTGAVIWRPAPSAVAKPTGTIREVSPDGSIAATVDASAPGDTIVLHAGSYPQVTLTRQFGGEPLRILSATGEIVTVGGFDISGGAGYLISGLRTNGESRLENAAHDVTFDHINCALPSGDTTNNCFYFHDSAYSAAVTNSITTGGSEGVKFYGCTGSSWAHDIRVFNSDLSGASADLIHVDCANNVTIEHNYLHDPIDNSDHNDGVQSQASDNLRILRNTFTFTSVQPESGPNQAMLLGNVPSEFPDRKVTNTLVANNLVHHWNAGRPLILNGTENTRIVNNTLVDSGAGISDPSITVSNQGAAGGQNPGLQIWNNIVDSVYYDEGSSPPAYFDTNLSLYRRHVPLGLHAVTIDPRFVNSTTYALAAVSKARRRGVVLPGTPSVDIDGKRRPRVLPGLGARV